MTNNFKDLITSSTECVNVTAFIYEWINYNYDNYITTNFYIENAFSKELIISNQLLHNYEDNHGDSSYSNKGYMFDTLIMLKDCLHHQCIYNPIINIHYTDSRQTVINGVRYNSNFFILDDILNSFTVAKSVLSKPIAMNNIIKQLKEYIIFIKLKVNHTVSPEFEKAYIIMYKITMT